MQTRLLLAAVLVVPLLASEGRAQSYTVKVKTNPAVGKSVTVTDSSDMRMAMVLSLKGMVLKDDKKNDVEETQFTTRVLEAGDPQPKKFTRTYTKAVKGEKGKPAKAFYQGETVVFELKGNAYQAVLQSGPVNDPEKLADLAKLAKNANKDSDVRALLPKTPVKVGDSWTISREALEVYLADAKDDADLPNAKAAGKLVKAYKQDGQQWGTLEYAFYIPLKKLGPLALNKPIPMQMKITVDTAIDGSSTASRSTGTASLKGSSEFVQNDMTFLLDLSMEGEFRGEHSAEK
jgi:hypothetical protein